MSRVLARATTEGKLRWWMQRNADLRAENPWRVEYRPDADEQHPWQVAEITAFPVFDAVQTEDVA